ncbi:flagellar protein FliT [Thauera linaloolentis]|uniref:Flagellar protein FliT n=1 Tax=Thauera linaloolentis (strain DSM 12138 / JCM 21573 / CCUG 41526 / CIP 105981 / IAM 15112 / NBRC 102519 / 47Lol) TaxID=1123367 RepID=N6YWS5_THAL4|nr:flagellar protein FliT [Thauera linaloolentis]ENO86852.1 flagellar-like protein FliT [Thauera linaloolentis 47Lol = DSM 12138]MCM8567104.1 flagellar protein FliT [Thauera linaloolentis]
MLTPEACRELLALYESMADAAVRNDWGRLAELEAASSTLRKAAAADPAGTAQLPDAVQREMASMIERMLELDATIRIHAEPCLESTRKLLAGTIRNRNVRNTYGSV